MHQFGDIVQHRGAQWVVSPSGSFSANSMPLVRLLRHSDDGNWRSHTVYATEGDFVSRPTFQVSQRVVVNGRDATVIALTPPDDVRIEYDPRSLPLGRGGGTWRDPGGVTDVPHWRLVLDNHIEGAPR